MAARPPLSLLAAEVRRHDRDRFVTALFAPADRREALFALYAFNSEVARIRELVSEPLLGEIRLQWWRDAIGKIYGGGEVAHPVATGLAAAIRTHKLSRELFERLIDARAVDLGNGPPATLTALEEYCAGTAATLTNLVLEALDARGEVAAHVARHAGVAWALVGLLRAVPFHAAAGRLYLPADLLGAHGVADEEILEGKSPPGLALVAQAMAARAREHLAAARAEAKGLPRDARAGLLTNTLADVYLARLRRARHDPMDRRWSSVRPPALRLTLKALSGRY